MPDINPIHFNKTAVEELKAALKNHKIPNALAFIGDKNTRKKNAAFFFAKAANCMENQTFPCENCRSCKKIEQGLHPDIRLVEPENNKKTIAISQVRALGDDISTRPNEAALRVVLISDSDLMTVQAQNALLKMIEEPPDRTVFILMAKSESGLLPTILSRCRTIRFKQLSSQQVRQYLIGEYGADPELAHIACETAGADVTTAVRYLGLDKEKDDMASWINARKWVLSQLASLTSSDRFGVSEALALSHRLSLSPVLMTDVLAVIQTFFRDLVIFGHNPDAIVNTDMRKVFSEFHQTLAPSLFIKWLESLFETNQRLMTNASVRLTLDRFFLKLVQDKG